MCVICRFSEKVHEGTSNRGEQIKENVHFSFSDQTHLIRRWLFIIVLIKSGYALCVDCILCNILSSVLIIRGRNTRRGNMRAEESRGVLSFGLKYECLI